MHALFGFFLIAAVLVIGLVLFAVWLIATILRAIVRMAIGPGLKSPPAVVATDPRYTRRCIREGCQAVNPVESRFCRRCGQRFEDPQHVAVRRAAML